MDNGKKFVGRSRAFAAFWMPILGLVLGQYAGADTGAEATSQIQIIVDGLLQISDVALVVAGAGMALWHKISPDGKGSTLVPEPLRKLGGGA